MSDRYDPKPSARPSGERVRATPGEEEDPLTELTRIVSGRSPFDSIPVRPERAASPTMNPQGPLPSESELARDLEAELLNELQASFSTIPEIVGRPQAAAALAAPQPPPPAPVAAQPPPIQRAPQAPAVAAPPKVSQPQAEPMDVLEELGIPADMLFRPPAAPDSDVPRVPQMVPLPPPIPPRAESQARPPQQQPKKESLASRIARAAQGPDRREAAAGRTEQPRAPAARQVVRAPQQQAQRVEPTAGQFRSTLAPNGSQGESLDAPRGASNRWDSPAEARRQSMPDLSRFAPLRGDAAAGEPARRREQADEQADDQDFVDDFQFPADEVGADEAPANQATDMVPGYGDDEQVPYPEDDFASDERRRSPLLSPALIAAVLGIVAIGGAAAIVFRPDSAPEVPPIITADTAPTKVAPDNSGTGEGESQAKLIYDRVDPGSEVADSKLIVPDEGPISDIPPIPSEATGDSAVSRVILEGGPGFDRPADPPDPMAPMDLTDGSATSAAPSAPETDPIGPKKVRTVVVRPDGTIVSSAASDGNGPAPAIPDVPPASETPPAPAADQNPLLADEFGGESGGGQIPLPPIASAPAKSVSIPDIPAPPPQAPAAPAPRVEAPAPPTVVATTGAANSPLDFTPGASAPQASTGGSGGGFLVQVSSQRSEETAMTTFRDLQRRYPSILGDRAPNIQRADLGERGVYFRVRVGYPTRDSAVEMCESLKAAGGDCILATR